MQRRSRGLETEWGGGGAKWKGVKLFREGFRSVGNRWRFCASEGCKGDPKTKLVRKLFARNWKLFLVDIFLIDNKNFVM